MNKRLSKAHSERAYWQLAIWFDLSSLAKKNSSFVNRYENRETGESAWVTSPKVMLLTYSADVEGVVKHPMKVRV
jgi:hypothetical protein